MFCEKSLPSPPKQSGWTQFACVSRCHEAGVDVHVARMQQRERDRQTDLLHDPPNTVERSGYFFRRKLNLNLNSTKSQTY